MNESGWVRYLESVLAVAQNGLAFSTDKHDIERFRKLQEETARALADAAGCDAARVRAWIDLDDRYATPKLDVRALILDGEGRVLLVKERQDEAWTLPGGWCDVGESAGEAVARETLEETGLAVSVVRLLALLDKRKHPHPPQLPHAHKAFFLCRVLGGTLSTSTEETSDARYWSVADLPELSKHRVLSGQIATLARRALAGEQAALFD
jgi:ADP-ribose pyrophosphatase YjhB (NUDIX family)